jgi:hypothetical protein
VYVSVDIQYWLKAEKEIPNHSAARIFASATSILKGGTPGAGIFYSGGVKKFAFDSASLRWDFSVALWR